MQRLRCKLAYANVMATIAVFIALGGGAYAATQLPSNSVGTIQIKNGAVTPAKLSEVSESSMPEATLWASVTGSSTLHRGRGATEAKPKFPGTGGGTVEVFFDRNVSKCGYAGTAGQPVNAEVPPTFISVQPLDSKPDGLYVQTFNVEGKIVPTPFYVEVFC
jgi:hypothetical protein